MDYPPHVTSESDKAHYRAVVAKIPSESELESIAINQLDPDLVKLETERTMLRETVVAWLNEHFGERCPEFESGCECCKRWIAADVLLEPVMSQEEREALALHRKGN